jgi:hypothetical protein
MCQVCQGTPALLEAHVAALLGELDRARRLVRRAIEQWDADLSRGLPRGNSIIMHSHGHALKAWLEGD